MGKEYLDAANELSDLANQFEDTTELSSVIREKSLKLIKKAVEHGAIIKTAEEKTL